MTVIYKTRVLTGNKFYFKATDNTFEHQQPAVRGEVIAPLDNR